MENPHGTLSLEATIPAAPAVVYAFFSNPHQTRQLQPFVRSVTVLKEHEVAGHQEIDFQAVEYVPMLGGLWKQRNVIEACWKLTEPPHRMQATAYSKPGVYLHIEYTYVEIPEGHTRLQLEIQWRAPRLFRSLVPKAARQAQTELLARLAAHFTSPSP